MKAALLLAKWYQIHFMVAMLAIDRATLDPDAQNSDRPDN